MNETKPFNIPKRTVYEAYLYVKRNKGAAGVDNESILEFERKLRKNLYKIWNRMSSGCYHPPPVKAVPIPKKSGGTRVLGVPTVSDRIAQMVVKRQLEPLLEPHFLGDSYGYRPGKSAKQAIEITRKRCWRYDWVLEFDIVGLFDNIRHDLLMKAVRKHTDCKWVLLYVERWLKAPMQQVKGELVCRGKGTPQGGVISPLLANLFLHYAFDKFMKKHFPDNPWARYADDGIAHCRTQNEAGRLLSNLNRRFQECGLNLHHGKTRIVYCKDADRGREYTQVSFDFLGYTFRPRLVRSKHGKTFVSFTPAISNRSIKSIRSKIKEWKLHKKTNWTLNEIAQIMNPITRGWFNYYGSFNKAKLYCIKEYIDLYLVKWAMGKFKKYEHRKMKAANWVGNLSKTQRDLFSHWQLGVRG